MCKAFSCIITRGKKVYWKLAIDSHEDIRDKFKLDTENKKRNTCAIEITPNNNNYVEPDKWDFKFDDDCPDWWKKSHEMACWSAHKEWYKQLRSKLHIKRLKNIIHPFKLPMVKKPTKKHIKLLKELAFVRGSVRGSVWGSVRDSVGDSVWSSVRDSVWDSVWSSVRDSLRAYIGWNFKIPRSKWKYTSKIKTKEYPFMSLIKLWKEGIVPSFDGEYWRLHSGPKAKIIFKISKKELGYIKKHLKRGDND